MGRCSSYPITQLFLPNNYLKTVTCMFIMEAHPILHCLYTSQGYNLNNGLARKYEKLSCLILLKDVVQYDNLHSDLGYMFCSALRVGGGGGLVRKAVNAGNYAQQTGLCHNQQNGCRWCVGDITETCLQTIRPPHRRTPEHSYIYNTYATTDHTRMNVTRPIVSWIL